MEHKNLPKKIESILCFPFLDFIFPVGCRNHVALDLNRLGILFLDLGLLGRRFFLRRHGFLGLGSSF